MKTTPPAQLKLHKLLIKAMATPGVSSFRALCEDAEAETIKLVAKYPRDKPLTSALVYIRQAIKFKKVSMSQQFIKKAIATFEGSYK